ncbi:MAG: SIMPL domain-containing protein [Bacteroidaceae bacterium]|nr:SIMPL domain-containing protein [Bacteroidaceae bacterium]
MESCENKKCHCAKILLPSIAIVSGLTLLGFFISKGLTKIANQEQYVTVKGLAECEVLANKVVWPLPYKCVSNDMQKLYSEIEKNKNIVLSYLKDGGITDSEIVISAPAVTDRLAQSYVPDNIQFRYQAEAVITVISPQVEKVIELMGKQIELMKDGVIISNEYNYQTQFEYTALNDIKPEMVEEATRNARAVAQKFAEDSDCELGNIRQATQGQFSISSDETTPQIKNIRVVTTVKYALE